MDFSLWLPVQGARNTQNLRLEHLPKMDAFCVEYLQRSSENLDALRASHLLRDIKPWFKTASDNRALNLSLFKFDSLCGYGINGRFIINLTAMTAPSR